MDERIKRLWVEELRANPERQGRESLRTPTDERCCLGVLCDLYQREHPDTEWIWSDHRQIYNFLGSEAELPTLVFKWAGLESNDPRVQIGYDPGNNTFRLTQVNDGHGCREHSFLEIADMIEEQL